MCKVTKWHLQSSKKQLSKYILAFVCAVLEEFKCLQCFEYLGLSSIIHMIMLTTERILWVQRITPTKHWTFCVIWRIQFEVWLRLHSMCKEEKFRDINQVVSLIICWCRGVAASYRQMNILLTVDKWQPCAISWSELTLQIQQLWQYLLDYSGTLLEVLTNVFLWWAG